MSDQWTADTYPAVPPDDKFRQDLQRALEQTHRQQMAQRKLGTQGGEKQVLSAGIIAAFLALIVAAAVAVGLWQTREKWSKLKS
ncbi:MAG: hypothetical protein U0X20_27815 [Caldilineaceae bacterium]